MRCNTRRSPDARQLTAECVTSGVAARRGTETPASQDHEKSSSHGGAAFFMQSALAGGLDRPVIPCVG
nr:MAG TPA: hypothetical protein [Inoviridae sp.]